MKFKLTKRDGIVSSSIGSLIGVVYSLKGLLGGLIYLIVLGFNEGLF